MGESWNLPELYAFYQTVIFELNQNPSLSIADVGKSYDLPEFSYSGSRDPEIHEKIQRDLFGVSFELPSEMCQAFSIIFKSKTQELNVPPPVVSKPSVHPSANWIHLGAAISALNLATPRESVISPPACDFPTPMAVTPREICTPRTQRLPRFSKWLLQALLSEEFLQFLQQQSQKSSSQQLTRMFGVMRMFFTKYGIELLYNHNPHTIYSFFQALDNYAVVKTALELYRGKPLDRWIDIRIVSESNEEDQKRFYEYFKMMIHLKVWLCNNRDNKPEFSAECDGKLWSFDEKTYSFHVSNLPDPSIIGVQARVA